MSTRMHWISKGLTFLCVLAIFASMAISPSRAAPAQPGPAPAFLSQPPAGSGEPARQPIPVLPAELPVYRLLPPFVNGDTAMQLANLFSGIGSGRGVITETTYTGTPAYLLFNEQTGAIFQQFGASGGFLAENSTNAFQEIPANLDYGPQIICEFLQMNELMPWETPPDDADCTNSGLTYPSNLIYLSILTPTLPLDNPYLSSVAPFSGDSAMQVIGQVWRVPLAFDIAGDAGVPEPVYIPLGGPGGHLSILLTGYDERVPLDNSLPGLQALAMPFRNREKEVIGLYPLVPMERAIQRYRSMLQAEFPGAVVDPGTPEIIYYAEDAAVVQEAIMPVWTFPNATADVGGEIVNLKEYTLPAVEGFLPEVSISNPQAGYRYFPRTPLTVEATITGSAGPFSYTLSVDGATPVYTGTAPAGEISIPLTSLPLDDRPGTSSFFLELAVRDQNGADNAAQVQLSLPSFAFLPVTMNSAGFQTDPPEPGFIIPASLDFIHTVGVEWVKNYHGTNTNLKKTQADADSFYSAINGLSNWEGEFRWYNDDAWEADWRDCSLGGVDCTWGADTAEFAYFSGHGGPAQIFFGVAKDNLGFWAEDARYSYLRWAAFSSCQTLRGGDYVDYGNPPLTYWYNAFQGAYMLLGFHSNMKDITFGTWFANTMLGKTFWGGYQQKSVREAWVLTAFWLNAGDPAYLYPVGNFNPVNAKLTTTGAGIPPVTGISSFHWVWWD